MANSIWQATAQTETGNIIAGAQVTVVNEDTGVNATIYSSIGGAALTNPFFANSEGFIQFYAGAGTNRVTAEDTGTGQSITWRYIRFGDSASKDTGTASDNVPLNSDLGSASTKDTGTASTNVPLNSDLGSASTKDTGTGSANVPLNSDLGNASLKNAGILTGQLPTSDDLNMVGASNNWTNLSLGIFGDFGFGTSLLMKNVSGGLIAQGQNVAAANLQFVFFSSSGVLTVSGFTVLGTYKATHGAIADDDTRTMTRVS
jgi:hypothetical protein